MHEQTLSKDPIGGRAGATDVAAALGSRVCAGGDRAERVHLGAFVVDLGAARLERNGEAIRLAPQPWRLLVLLVESEGRLLSHDQIRETLWRDQIVEFDQCLAHCLRKLRQALGDDARQPTYIETVPRRGLRLLRSVTREIEHGEQAEHEPAEDVRLLEGPPEAVSRPDSRKLAAPGRLVWAGLGAVAIGLGATLTLLLGFTGGSAPYPAATTAQTESAEPALEIRFFESGPRASVATDTLLRQVRERVEPALSSGVEAALDLRLHGAERGPNGRGPSDDARHRRLEGALYTGAEEPVRVAIDFPEEVAAEVVVLDLVSEIANQFTSWSDAKQPSAGSGSVPIAEELTLTLERSATPGEI